MTPSSEEIAAALEVAIEDLEQFSPLAPIGHAKARAAARTLAAHLSRLREEAEFRDAARVIGRIISDSAAHFERTEESKLDIKEYGAAEKTFIAAYRALEEPRDA